MHPVTKILVVFAAVLSVLLSALTVAYSANAERIKSQFQSARQQAQTAEATLAAEQAKNAEARAGLNADIAKLEDVRTDLEREKNSLLQANAQLSAEAKQARAELQATQSKIDQLAAAARTQSTLISSYRDELSSLRAEELDSKQRQIELVDQISDLSAQLEVAQEANRALQEQLAEIRVAQGTTGLAGATGDGDGFQRPLRARVTNVRRDASGDLLAEIDAGSNDRLREGMTLMITRDNQFIANLDLRTVELNEAVGKVNTLRREVEVRPDDVVLSSSTIR